MTPILILFDGSVVFDSEVRELLTQGLTYSGYQCDIAEVSDVDALTSPEFVQRLSKYKALLIGISSSDSPSWSLIEQIHEEWEGMTVPIIAMLRFSSEVVGPKYEVWIEHYTLLTDYISIPFAFQHLVAMLSDVVGKESADPV
jgi:DNA-binding response OmpR family regulator